MPLPVALVQASEEQIVVASMLVLPESFVTPFLDLLQVEQTVCQRRPQNSINPDAIPGHRIPATTRRRLDFMP